MMDGTKLLTIAVGLLMGMTAGCATAPAPASNPPHPDVTVEFSTNPDDERFTAWGVTPATGVCAEQPELCEVW